MEKREEALKDYLPAKFYGKYENKWSGGTRHFEGVPASVLTQMVEDKLADPEECQNSSPTIKDFIELMDSIGTLTAHGYIVSEGRDDARTSVEGVSGFVPTENIAEAVNALHRADEFTIEQVSGGFMVHSWWD